MLPTIGRSGFRCPSLSRNLCARIRILRGFECMVVARAVLYRQSDDARVSRLSRPYSRADRNPVREWAISFDILRGVLRLRTVTVRDGAGGGRRLFEILVSGQCNGVDLA